MEKRFILAWGSSFSNFGQFDLQSTLARFIAAIIVILFHRTGQFEYLNHLPPIFRAGPAMCTFFFVLSGFSLSVNNCRNAKIKLLPFMGRRLLKIYPVHLFALLLVFFLVLISKNNLLWIDLLLSAGLIQSWIPPYSLSLNGPSWFLSSLFFCYFTFPPLINILSCSEKLGRHVFLSFALWGGTIILVTMLRNSDFYQGYPSKSHDLIS